MKSVEEVLKDNNLSYTVRGSDCLIKCLNPEHDDNNPSMGVDQENGIFFCFSCGFKGNIYSFFNIATDVVSLRRSKLKKLIDKKRAETIGIEKPKGWLPYKYAWRGISPKTYKKFEAFTHTDLDFVNRIVFPIRRFNGAIAGFIGRHTLNEPPKYKVVPKGAKLPLFPYVKPYKGSIMLVEGIYDLLRLYEGGISHAMCCLGVNRVTPDKLQNLKLMGATKIDVFFDSDEAGQKGSANVEALCEKAELGYRNIVVTGVNDPGDLTNEQVLKLKAKLYD